MKKFVKLRIHKLILIMACAALLFGVHLGYSIITSNLDVDGNVKVKKGCEYDIGKEWYFETVGEHSLEIKCDGVYKLEVWGAEGGASVNKNTETGKNTYYIRDGGYGGYSVGELSILKNNYLYINVGGQPSFITNSGIFNIFHQGGYNGGGNSTVYNGGGGATHIAFTSGTLEELGKKNLSDKVLIVAGGGGGSSVHTDGGGYCLGESGGGSISGLGVNGRTSKKMGTSATQTTGYKFGKGESSDIAPGAGGGWYGGYSASNPKNSWDSWTTGGSGYLNPLLENKAMYCYNCTKSDNILDKTITESVTASSTPLARTAKSGNGYAKITLISYT